MDRFYFKKTYSIQDIYNIFDIPPTFQCVNKTYPSIEEANKKLEGFKKAFKKGYRMLAHYHHPDHGGAKEKMQTINMIYSNLMKTLSLIRRQPPPRPQVVHYYYYSTAGYSGYGGSSTTTAYW